MTSNRIIIISLLSLSITLALTSALLVVKNIELSSQFSSLKGQVTKLEKDQGDFIVQYVPVKNPDYKKYEVLFKQFHIVENNVEKWNNRFYLPVNITISVSECGASDPHYDPINKKIFMCYETVRLLSNSLPTKSRSENELTEDAYLTNYFILFHELGHSLVDVYQLPITGKEEDAVDQLAAIILINSSDNGIKAVKAASNFFKSHDPETYSRFELSDVHSLDIQRFYNLVCLIYGSNIQGNSYLLDEDILPEDRAAGCEKEYERVSTSWNILLSPHMK